MSKPDSLDRVGPLFITMIVEVRLFNGPSTGTYTFYNRHFRVEVWTVHVSRPSRCIPSVPIKR